MFALRLAAATMLVTIIRMNAGVAADTGGVAAGLAEFQQGRFAEALADWQRAADAGEATGALYAGVLYDSGQGVKQDYGQALSWYRRAAEAGSPAGDFNVGVLYDAGLGVAKDPSAAAAWYARAAAHGYGRAEYNLAMLYESGAGVPRNVQRAGALYRRAAAHGISAAGTHLAALRLAPVKGPERPQDTAMGDFQQAQQMLLSRGPAEAARTAALFRSAAEQHNALAEYDLAYCYERGLGVAKNEAQAHDWYVRAAHDAKDGALRTLAQDAATGLESH